MYQAKLKNNMNQLPEHPASTSADRWEELKPIIEQLYLEEKQKLANVVLKLKNDYSFDALEHQYKYHFKKWKWKRSIPSSKKEEIAEQLTSRALVGKRGTNATLYGRTVEPHKMRRYMKTKAREDSQNIILKKSFNIGDIVAGPVLPFANSIFLKWNLPYAAMLRSHARPFDHTSPVGISVPTPGSDIAVATPSSASSPCNAPSPTTVFVNRKVAIDRAHLFTQGQHDKLLLSLDGEEKRVMSEWLYQYWLFCFKTVKNWGKGPPAWTAKLLDFDRFQSHHPRSLPGTPGDLVPHSEHHLEHGPTLTSLCRWFIHVYPQDYEEIPEEEDVPDPTNQDPNDESTWSPWPSNWQEPPLPTRLRDALEHNDFSSIPPEGLPVAIPQIAKAAQRSPDELLLESLGFSIMSRNLTQVESILDEMKQKGMDFISLYPLHIATSYLDGYKACCDIFRILLKYIPRPVNEVFVNDLGHTVLDNLMISILKSHSSTMPAAVDDNWKDTTRFTGDEVDICGRWDADSPCVRHLLANGNPLTPFAWKHKFCHTSIQTVCHCIGQMVERGLLRRMTETASGLYLRRCFDCGMKIQLEPLHSLVVTAYHLADHGCQDEDLFGMLACLLCLVSCGINPRETANVSVAAIMQTDIMEVVCDHDELTPAELAEKISAYPVVRSWSAKVRSGWEVFCGVLRLCEENSAEPDSDEDFSAMDEDENYSRHIIGASEPNGFFLSFHLEGHPWVPCFRGRRDLATLWASVQAELLTYRRLDEGMDWISQRFSMEKLRTQLERGETLSVEYVEQDLLKPHCVCGSFDCFPLATVSDATNPDIANLDVWERATYGAIVAD